MLTNKQAVSDNTIILFLQTLILTNNSRAFALWSKPPVHPKIKVHIFNYTNVDAFIAGKAEKLRVQDIGPYVYE